METIHKTIEVDQPIRTVHAQWTQFENLPRFMSGGGEVRQLDAANLHWKADPAGKTMVWDATITEQVVNLAMAWRSTVGPDKSGTVRFETILAGRTKVTLSLNYAPAGLLKNGGDSRGMVESRVAGDLQKFKEYSESAMVNPE